MPGRSRRGFTPRRAKRAAPAWGFVGSTVDQGIIAGTKVLLASFILSNPPLGETILRTRVRLFVRSDNETGTEEQVGAFGLVVVTDAALAAGAGSIPGPFTDGGDDGWFVHQSIWQGASFATANGATGYDIDSKAMRKVEDGHSIAIMVENASGEAFQMQVGIAVRLLAKLTES